ncbi:carbohydrate-binding domain-containing protein [Methylobacterium sp. 37f]|uniref:carbohydrate-binding domain-containing protein n=1 Tax=Methylobacterium sp. 37f TaxID=2817058 RepID=UPI001FFC97DC|nr:carbohydrate-binding domain-containing protein [Methylobacterium sp. 37f]MCK2056351.1 hypothetical protein [Methylobacterium sp. 37f]
MADTFTFRVSEDKFQFQADAEFVIKINGVIYGDVLTATASHIAGRFQDFSFAGDFSNAQQISVTFLNDIANTTGGDRNLYVDSFTYNGATVSGASASYTNGGQSGGSTGLYKTFDTAAFNVNGFGGNTEVATFTAEGVNRFFNMQTGGHFFTISAGENAQVLSTRPDLRPEGIGFGGFATDQGAATEEVYRFFNTKTGGHFFTTSEGERDQVIATNQDYRLEGVGFYDFVVDKGAATEEVYRFFNTKTGGHFFTASEGERDQVIATNQDYRFEGIAFYAPDHAGTFVV